MPLRFKPDAKLDAGQITDKRKKRSPYDGGFMGRRPSFEEPPVWQVYRDPFGSDAKRYNQERWTQKGMPPNNGLQVARANAEKRKHKQPRSSLAAAAGNR